MSSRVVFLLAAALALQGLSGAQDVVNVDFESAAYTSGATMPGSDNVHSPPLTWTVEGDPAFGTATIQSSLISGGGAKALEMNDTSGSDGPSVQEDSAVASQNGGAGMAAGRLEFDYRCLHATNTQPHYVRMGQDGQGNFDKVIHVMFVAGGNIVAKQSNGSGGQNNLIVVTGYKVSTDYHVSVDFDLNTRKFSITVVEDPLGTPVVFGPLESDIVGDVSLTGAKFIRIGTAAGQTPHFQIDNLRLIPPASRVEDWREIGG